MKDIAVPVERIGDEDGTLFGGKASSLGAMVQRGLKVPTAVGISAHAYDRYVDSTGLRGKILLELNRKSFEEMRWEEMWDASVRIMSIFSTTPIPRDLKADLEKNLSMMGEKEVAVRSSAIGEDTATTSFAGIHESYVNVRGVESILDHVRKVWASLWSDGAILYRKELDLDIETSTMAVVVQEMVFGEKSGVVFGINPNQADQTVIEAVYGLNQGLVDGTVEPDRWILDRNTGSVLAHQSARRDKIVLPTESGTELAALSSEKTSTPPLKKEEVAQVYRLAMEAEAVFGHPQDVEWTFRRDELYLLQSRPITTGPKSDSDKNKVWYLSLKRSFENLKDLRKRVEDEHIPKMIREAQRLDKMSLSDLSDEDLASEIERRGKILDKWHDVYWDEFIPFAHGVRLFGQVYNDLLNPEDPYEFVDLLGGGEMLSLERNRRLEEMADEIRKSPNLTSKIKSGDLTPPLEEELDDFMSRFGGKYSRDPQSKEGMKKLLVEMALRPPKEVWARSSDQRREDFLSRFQGEKRDRMEELLELAVVSYRLRDDDNIHLGKLDAQLAASLNEGRSRLERRGLSVENIPRNEIAPALRDPDYRPRQEIEKGSSEPKTFVRARQLVGQPAGPGVATGKARVIKEEADLFQFKSGEVLVVDAIDPNMTFVVPIASGIVERRGGMLIHGSIIAREYGVPCVTGISDASDIIQTEDIVTVDGFLGIVTIERPAKEL